VAWCQAPRHNPFFHPLLCALERLSELMSEAQLQLMFRHEFGQSTWHVLDGEKLGVSRGAWHHATAPFLLFACALQPLSELLSKAQLQEIHLN